MDVEEIVCRTCKFPLKLHPKGCDGGWVEGRERGAVGTHTVVVFIAKHRGSELIVIVAVV